MTHILINKNKAVVVAQLVERLLSIPDVCGSNPVIGKKLFWAYDYCQLQLEWE